MVAYRHGRKDLVNDKVGQPCKIALSSSTNLWKLAYEDSHIVLKGGLLEVIWRTMMYRKGSLARQSLM